MKNLLYRLIKHGFERIQGGASRGAYSHPKFIRGDPKSCLSIEKVKRSKSSDETCSVKDPAVKLGEMSEHFQQAVQESRPLKLKARCQKKANWNEPRSVDKLDAMWTGLIDHDLETIMTEKLDVNERSFSWMGNESVNTAVLKPEYLSTHRRSNSTLIGTANCFDLRGSLGKSHSSPGKIEGMWRTQHPPNNFGRQNMILSKFLPARLPGHSDLNDLNSSGLLSDLTDPSKPDLQPLHADFPSSSPTISLIQGNDGEVPSPLPFRMAPSLFDQSTDDYGDFWDV